MRPFTAILILALSVHGLGAQAFLVTRTSGVQIHGDPVAIRGTGTERALELATPTGRVAIPFGDILGVHGRAPDVRAPVAVYLNGGGELKGELTGGDKEGNYLFMKSAALGERRLSVDRLKSILFREHTTGAAPGDFLLGASNSGEALFRKALRGFDLIPGELDRFTPEGVLFAEAGGVARLFRYETLAALSIRDGQPPAKPADWLLVTVSGDRLRVGLSDVQAATIQIATEFGPVTLPRAQVAALTSLAGDRLFLSDLTPVRVAESGSDGEVDGDALMPFRRDRTVSGGVLARERSPSDGFLVVGGHTYGKGLGVHSRCVLSYTVPPGMTRFYARVAIDDEVKSLGVKGDVDVTVRMGEKVVFRKEGVRRGQAPETTGVLPVTPGQLLTLEVDFGKGLFLGDRVDWLSAVFLK